MPVLPCIGQKGMSSQQSHRRGYGARLQWMVVRQSKRRFVNDSPAHCPRPPAQVDVLVVEEERVIEAPHLFQQLSPNQQAAAGDPSYRSSGGASEMILAPGAWQQ